MKVLFCVDESRGSEAALSIGAKLVRRAASEVTTLHVLPEVDERLRHYEKLHEEELTEIERLFGRRNDQLRVVTKAKRALARLGLEATRKVRTGDPANEILAEIKEGGYDLVVVGFRSETGMARLLHRLGSVSRRVCEGSSASVLVVKDPTRSGQRG